MGSTPMATIALYADKINQMSGLIGDLKKSVGKHGSELFSRKNCMIGVKKSVCGLDGAIASVRASTQIQEEKPASGSETKASYRIHCSCHTR
jgi:hypothetical protein